MRIKKKVLLLEVGDTRVYGDLTISMSLSQAAVRDAQSIGSSEAELQNAASQKFWALVDLLGNTEEV